MTENIKKKRDELQAKLNKVYPSFEEFVEACAIDIYSTEKNDASMDSQDKQFNMTQFLTAYAKEDALYLSRAEESNKDIPRPISSAILFKMLMPFIAKEMKATRQFGKDTMSLSERYRDETDQIFTDIYLDLAHAINLFDFKKIKGKTLNDAQTILCGYTKFYAYAIIQNYVRDNLSKTDVASGRKSDVFLEDIIAHRANIYGTNKQQYSHPDERIINNGVDEQSAISNTDIDMGLVVYNEIPEEINENSSLPFKQARVLKYIMEYNGRFITRSMQTIEQDQKFRYSVIKSEPGAKTPKTKCYTLRVYNNMVSGLNKQIKRTTQLMNGNIQGALLDNFNALKKLSEDELDKIITDFNIPEFELDSYYHGYYHDFVGIKCNTSTALHEITFSQDKLPYTEKVERKPIVHSEEFYKNHPNYKRNDEEGEIEHE